MEGGKGSDGLVVRGGGLMGRSGALRELVVGVLSLGGLGVSTRGGCHHGR